VSGRILFDSTASAAESLRSKWGSERRPPECIKQRWPGETPQVGQGTAVNCSGVRSRIRIGRGCRKRSGKTVQNGTVPSWDLETADPAGQLQGISVGEAAVMVCLLRANRRLAEATPAPRKRNRPEGVYSKPHVPANGDGRGRIERRYLDWAPKGFSLKRGRRED